LPDENGDSFQAEGVLGGQGQEGQDQLEHRDFAREAFEEQGLAGDVVQVYGGELGIDLLYVLLEQEGQIGLFNEVVLCWT